MIMNLSAAFKLPFHVTNVSITIIIVTKLLKLLFYIHILPSSIGNSVTKDTCKSSANNFG